MTIGQWLPFWLLGAPLFLGIVELMQTPRIRPDRRPNSFTDDVGARHPEVPIRR